MMLLNKLKRTAIEILVERLDGFQQKLRKHLERVVFESGTLADLEVTPALEEEFHRFFDELDGTVQPEIRMEPAARWLH